VARPGHRRKCDSIPDSGSVPPARPNVVLDVVAALAACTVRAGPVVHLPTDDRRFGHRVLRLAAAATPARTRRPACPGRPPAAPRRRPGQTGGARPPGRLSGPAGRRWGPSPASPGCSYCRTHPPGLFERSACAAAATLTAVKITPRDSLVLEPENWVMPSRRLAWPRCPAALMPQPHSMSVARGL
jgi:hypothetical protein